MRLETERCLIRPIHTSDNAAVFAYRSDKVTNQYQGRIPETLDEVDQMIRQNPSEFNQPDTWFQLVMIDKSNDLLLGDIGVHFVDQDGYQVELGCTLAKENHGRGIATEALTAIVEHLFQHHAKHRIFASIDPRNTASANLLERLGFRKEAHFKQSLMISGQWVDDVIYALLASEWRQRRSQTSFH